MATGTDDCGFLSDGELKALEALSAWALSFFGVGGIVAPAVTLAMEIGNRALTMGQTVPSADALRAKAARIAAFPDLPEDGE